MSAVASKSKSRKASTSKVDSVCPPFSEKEYKEYLKSRSRIHNEAANASRNTSIFDAMEAVRGEFDKKIYGGMSINDMFKSLQ